tara:strand:- start:3402 stop:3614 length:213 start_codon:yes stop_codon:yes gene_type:complete
MRNLALALCFILSQISIAEAQHACKPNQKAVSCEGVKNAKRKSFCSKGKVSEKKKKKMCLKSKKKSKGKK